MLQGFTQRLVTAKRTKERRRRHKKLEKTPGLHSASSNNHKLIVLPTGES